MRDMDSWKSPDVVSGVLVSVSVFIMAITCAVFIAAFTWKLFICENLNNKTSGPNSPTHQTQAPTVIYHAIPAQNYER